MLFSARDRLKSDHVVGGALALLVQAIFALLVLLSPSHSTRPASLARETLLFFPPLVVPAPSTIDARGPRRSASHLPPRFLFRPLPRRLSQHRLWRLHRGLLGTWPASARRCSAAPRSIMPICRQTGAPIAQSLAKAWRTRNSQT